MSGENKQKHLHDTTFICQAESEFSSERKGSISLIVFHLEIYITGIVGDVNYEMISVLIENMFSDEVWR